MAVIQVQINLDSPIKGTGNIYLEFPLFLSVPVIQWAMTAHTLLAINLLTDEVIYEYGMDDVFSERTDNDCFTAFDSSPWLMQIQILLYSLVKMEYST